MQQNSVASRIQTRIVGVEGKDTVHYTTHMAQFIATEAQPRLKPGTVLFSITFFCFYTHRSEMSILRKKHLVRLFEFDLSEFV